LELLDYEVCSSPSLLTVCSAVENFSVEYPLIVEFVNLNIFEFIDGMWLHIRYNIDGYINSQDGTLH